MDDTIYVAKIKALIGCAVTCAFVFVYAENRISDDVAQVVDTHATFTLF